MEGNTLSEGRIVIPVWDAELDEPATLPALWERISAFPIISLPAIHEATVVRHGHDRGDALAIERFFEAVEETVLPVRLRAGDRDLPDVRQENDAIISCTSPFWRSNRAPVKEGEAFGDLLRDASLLVQLSGRAQVERIRLGRRDLDAIAALRVVGRVREVGARAVAWESTSGTLTLGDAIDQIEAAILCRRGELRTPVFREPLTTLQRRGATTTVLGPGGEYEIVLGARPQRLRRLDDTHDLWVGAGRVFVVSDLDHHVSDVLEATARPESYRLDLPAWGGWLLDSLGERFLLPADPDERDAQIGDGLAELCGLPIT